MFTFILCFLGKFSNQHVFIEIYKIIKSTKEKYNVLIILPTSDNCC